MLGGKKNAELMKLEQYVSDVISSAGHAVTEASQRVLNLPRSLDQDSSMVGDHVASETILEPDVSSTILMNKSDVDAATI